VLVKHGTLLSNVCLSITLPEVNVSDGILVRWKDNIGEQIINDVCFEIDNERIVRLNGDYMRCSKQLKLSVEDQLKHDEMSGHIPLLTTFTNHLPSTTVLVPLNFWFCDNLDNALPIQRITKDVTILAHLRDIKDCLCLQGGDNTMYDAIYKSCHVVNSSIISEYSNIEQPINNTFAIKQIDMVNESIFRYNEPDKLQSIKIRVDFRYPVAELIWTFFPEVMWSYKDDNTLSHDYQNIMKNYLLQLDNCDVGIKLDGDYYSKLMPQKHHTKVPTKAIYAQPFMDNPDKQFELSDEIKMCNFATLESATMCMDIYSYKISHMFVYAICINIMTIDEDGMVSLKYGYSW
jgi:hypothetical protein